MQAEITETVMRCRCLDTKHPVVDDYATMPGCTRGHLTGGQCYYTPDPDGEKEAIAKKACRDGDWEPVQRPPWWRRST